MPARKGTRAGKRSTNARNGQLASASEIDGPSWSIEELGRLVRVYRTKREMSLAELAEESGLSPSFLSQVENGLSDMSIGRLARVAQSLQVPLTDLLAPPKARTNRPFLAAEERLALRPEPEGIRAYVLAPSLNGSHQYFESHYAPGGATHRRDWRGDEVFLFVTDGELTVEFEDGDVRLLSIGDSMSFLTNDLKLVENRSDAPAVLITVVFPHEP